MEKEVGFELNDDKEKKQYYETDDTLKKIQNYENVDNIETKKIDNDIQKEDNNKIVKISKKRNIVFQIISIICIVMYCMALAPKVLQNDTFYTIKIGEYIYNNGISNLTRDVYSWHELPYTYPHWLYDFGMFIIYNLCGQAGIYASTMVLSAILGISIFVLSNKKSKNSVISFIISIFAMYLIRDFVAARAQLVTFILFTWTVYFIEKFIETAKIKYGISLIIIPLLIANLHSAVFPFYFILFLPYIGEYIWLVFEDSILNLRLFSFALKILKKISRKENKIQKINNKLEKIKLAIPKRKEKIKNIRNKPFKIIVSKKHTVLLLISVMLIAVLTGFLNPAGTGAYSYLYKTIKGNTTDSINEHLPLTLIDNKEFAITLIIFLLILVFTDTKIKLHDLFMLSGITFLAFNSRRQVSMFAIFCMPILANLVSDMVEKYDRETFIKIERFFSGWFGAVVIICCFIILSTNVLKPHFHNEYIDGSVYPIEASDWILANLDVSKIRLYNEYNYGSYLLFRGIPVFIDSRCDLYSPEFNEDKENGIDGRDIFSDALNIAGLSVNYNAKFEEYGVTHIILYENSKLAMILKNDSDYNLIYSKGNFVIFERLNIGS